MTHKFRSIEGAAQPTRPARLQVRAQPSGGRERRPACRRRYRRVRLYRSNSPRRNSIRPFRGSGPAGLQLPARKCQAGGNLRRAGGNQSRFPDGAERREEQPGHSGTPFQGGKSLQGNVPLSTSSTSSRMGTKASGSPDGGWPGERVKALGGFFISADLPGAVTNNHVVDGASKIERSSPTACKT